MAQFQAYNKIIISKENGIKNFSVKSNLKDLKDYAVH